MDGERSVAGPGAGPRRALLRTALGVIAAAFVLGGLYLRANAPAPQTVEAAGESASRQLVQTLAVESHAVRPRVRLAGVLEARRRVELVSETQGRVTAIGAEELDRVSAGQVLVEVEPLLAQTALERAEASLARARSELSLARANLERRRSLAGREVVSESVLDDAENASRVAGANLREARAVLREARDALEKKTLRAPFDGVLRSFQVEVGDTFQMNQRLGELLDLSAARVRVGLSDREVVAVRAGQLARVETEAYPGETFEAEVLRVGAAADATTRKFPVEVEAPNPAARLLPGMVAQVTLDLGAPVSRLLIPRDATLDEFGLRLVYVIEPDGSADAWVARRRRVRVRSVPFQPEQLEVLEGVEVGEEIAVTGVRQLRDGEPVRRKGRGPG